jgi:hypothetical protein
MYRVVIFIFILHLQSRFNLHYPNPAQIIHAEQAQNIHKHNQNM